MCGNSSATAGQSDGVGGPANAIQRGRRRRCTNYGWPVGPTA